MNSEDNLVQKLDEYIAKNQESNPDIIKKLKPSIESLRLLVANSEATNKCEVPAYKNALLQQKRKLDEIDLSVTHSLNKRPRKKVTLISKLPIEMVNVLFRKFTDENRVLKNYVTNQTDYFVLLKIYDEYNHTDLSKYSDQHIEAILFIFKKEGRNRGGDFKVFKFYKDYL